MGIWAGGEAIQKAQGHGPGVRPIQRARSPGSPHSSIEFAFVFQWTLLCFRSGSALFSNGSPSFFYWDLVCLLLGSPLLSKEFRLVF